MKIITFAACGEHGGYQPFCLKCNRLPKAPTAAQAKKALLVALGFRNYREPKLLDGQLSLW